MEAWAGTSPMVEVSGEYKPIVTLLAAYVLYKITSVLGICLLFAS